MLTEATLAQIAKYSGVSQRRTSISTGANEFFVDGPQVPQDSIGIVTQMSDGHPGINGSAFNMGCFICDASMGWGNSPLLADGSLDPNLIGVFVGGDGSTLQNMGSFMLQNYVFLAPRQFMRFATFHGPGVFPNLGDFQTIRIAMSIIPICECNF